MGAVTVYLKTARLAAIRELCIAVCREVLRGSVNEVVNLGGSVNLSANSLPTESESTWLPFHMPPGL